jgi:hypothetical protein
MADAEFRPAPQPTAEEIEAKLRAEQEEKAKAEHEKEAKEIGEKEKEAKEKEAKEAEQRESEAKEKAAREAEEQAAKDAQAMAAKEKEELERQAQENAEKEAAAKAVSEPVPVIIDTTPKPPARTFTTPSGQIVTVVEKHDALPDHDEYLATVPIIEEKEHVVAEVVQPPVVAAPVAAVAAEEIKPAEVAAPATVEEVKSAVIAAPVTVTAVGEVKPIAVAAPVAVVAVEEVRPAIKEPSTVVAEVVKPAVDAAPVAVVVAEEIKPAVTQTPTIVVNPPLPTVSDQKIEKSASIDTVVVQPPPKAKSVIEPPVTEKPPRPIRPATVHQDVNITPPAPAPELDPLPENMGIFPDYIAKSETVLFVQQNMTSSLSTDDYIVTDEAGIIVSNPH